MNTTLMQTASALRSQARQLRQAATTLETEAEYVEAAALGRGQAEPHKAGRRWLIKDDAYLIERAGTLMAQGVHGDKLAEALAVELERSPVAVAARLVNVGVWS